MNTQFGYDFDDLYLVPKLSNVNSRNEVSLSVNLGTIVLEVPIIASPMRGISNPNLIIELGKCGGIGILHRFYDNKVTRYNDISTLVESEIPFGVAVKLNDPCYEEILGVFRPDILCVDVANGYLELVRRFCEEVSNLISRKNYHTLLMAGNVVTYWGAKALKDCGVDLIRVGIGSGQLCTTRVVTGVGYPQLSAINDCSGFRETPFTGQNYSNYEYKQEIQYIVADGGIRNSGDIVKALAAGADVVMIGSLFGTCIESNHNGVICGMASRQLQEEYYHSVKSVEGKELPIEKTTTVKDLISELSWGMKSAFTYLNAKDIYDLQAKATWVKSNY